MEAPEEQKIQDQQMDGEDEVEISEDPIEVDLTEDLYVGDNHEDIVSNFVCMICFGIVFKPVKCLQCETLYCGKCVEQNKKGHGENEFDCLKNCGSKACTDKLARLEKIIMNQLVFSCQNDGCEEKIKYSNYFNHLEFECKVLRYNSILLNGDEMSLANKRRITERKLKLRIEQIGHIIAIAEKPDWIYDKEWNDAMAPIKALENAGLNTNGQCFTMEAAVMIDVANGGRIASWRRHSSGFEWIGPRENNKTMKLYARYNYYDVGKEIELQKYYVLGLQWEPFEEVQDDGSKKKKVKVRTYINHEFDAEKVIDFGNQWINLECGTRIAIGDTAYVHNEANVKFQGNIDYVKIWKKLDVGPYAPKPKEEEKKEEEMKDEEKKDEEVKAE